MRIIHSLATGVFGLMALSSVQAASQQICVFDIMGSNGDIMAIAKDYTLVAKQWGVDIEAKTYTSLEQALSDFEAKKCQAIIADNYATKKYNTFMGTVGAVGAVHNHDLATKIFYALGSPKLASKLKSKNYEVAGYIPYGLAYIFTKDKTINSVKTMRGKRLGVLGIDPSQARMATRLGMTPVNMSFDSAASDFRKGKMDIVPAPKVVYKPFEVQKIIGSQGGVANYPLAFMSMNLIMHRDAFPASLGQKSRAWFSKKTPQMMKMVERWDATVPAQVTYGIPEEDRQSYDLLLSQLRKEFIANKTYDAAMITLIRHLRCNQDPSFIECKK
ncbi:hypothetical protein SAMN05421749_1056 [Acinetobacter marinus]|uniref:TRAP-type C4-dicarboxylate transport system, substrate-binding protein n=1 Tax=Acinetobacter marinus TaxID=281375 RepID=A0A1G6LD12_9GAMM|nr:putative solute-binding protein [Acinetobacter marinus]SDC40526.1 hypothetical protein SAMN05421749_1056 [Acinetobacter marinus]